MNGSFTRYAPYSDIIGYHRSKKSTQKQPIFCLQLLVSLKRTWRPPFFIAESDRLAEVKLFAEFQKMEEQL